MRTRVPGLVDNRVASSGALRFSCNGQGTALVTGITYHNITPTNHYTIAASLPSQTKAVMIQVRYTHGGYADHGYWSMLMSQRGTTLDEDKAYGRCAHFDDYYNTETLQMFIPWGRGTSQQELTIQTVASMNTNALNRYDVYFMGYIEG